jgi:hypothetical protein
MGNARCCSQENNLSREKVEKSSQRKVILDIRIVQFPPGHVYWMSVGEHENAKASTHSLVVK